MTIHHIDAKCKLYPYHPIHDMRLYKQRYSVNLALISMADMLSKNIRTGIFDFEDARNGVYDFLENFVGLRRSVW